MVKLFVEGGGNHKTLRTECRKSFTIFLTKVGLSGKMPRVVASGPRSKAYDDFCAAVKNQEPAMMLVDSEVVAEVTSYHPWSILSKNTTDQWEKPEGSLDKHCHLMVVCMESWFLADLDTLSNFYGSNFNKNELIKKTNHIENTPKELLFNLLENATKNCKTKSKYIKNEHSFKLLALLNPKKVEAASGWAKRLFDELKNL
jgi:hypothetical protein